jgi:hypothetical protein
LIIDETSTVFIYKFACYSGPIYRSSSLAFR